MDRASQAGGEPDQREFYRDGVQRVVRRRDSPDARPALALERVSCPGPESQRPDADELREGARPDRPDRGEPIPEAATAVPRPARDVPPAGPALRDLPAQGERDVRARLAVRLHGR